MAVTLSSKLLTRFDRVLLARCRSTVLRTGHHFCVLVMANQSPLLQHKVQMHASLRQV